MPFIVTYSGAERSGLFSSKSILDTVEMAKNLVTHGHEITIEDDQGRRMSLEALEQALGGPTPG